MTIHFHIDTSEVDHLLQHIEDTSGAVLALEGVLAASFAATQMVTHVITGSLRNSGAISSEYRDHVWRGEISYGGVSPGFPHDPVRYAELEQARGGAHDFIRPAVDATPEYPQAISNWLLGATE